MQSLPNLKRRELAYGIARAIHGNALHGYYFFFFDGHR